MDITKIMVVETGGNLNKTLDTTLPTDYYAHPV